MADSDGFPIDVQRAIEHCAALIMQSVDLETFQSVEWQAKILNNVLGPGINVAHLPSLMAGARRRFEAALAAGICARNARASAIFSVPNELWLSTWSYLPPNDRVSVSQVCRAWREVALSVPTLWTEIVLDYQTSVPSGNSYWQCVQCGGDGLPATIASPLAFICTLLDHSAGLPVCVRFENYHDMLHMEYLKDVGRLLEQHNSRLEGLHFSVGSGSYLAVDLLDTLRTLPALRTLTVSMYEEDERLSEPLFEASHAFPVLESLTIPAGLSWGYSFELPRLRALSLPVYDPSCLSIALRDCPALQSLRIVPRFKANLPWDATLLARLRTVPDVCIDGMENTRARWFAETDMPAPGTRVRLVHPFSQPSGAALRVLRSFSAPVHALCAVDAGRHHLALSDASRTLVLEWPLARGVSSIWDFVGPADPAAWPGLLSRLPPARAAGVRCITLRLRSSEEIVHMALDPGGRCSGFPALTELIVRAMQPGIVLHAARITALRDQLRLPTRLKLLRLAGARVLGDVREMDEIADTVAYVAYSG